MGGSWLDLQNVEYLASRPNATRFATYIEGRAPLLVSAIEIHEVYRVIRRDLSEERAVEAVSVLRRATIAPVDESLALEAADADFEGLPDAVVIRCDRAR